MAKFFCFQFLARRESYGQIRRVLYRSLFCVNQWEREQYFVLFGYWLKSKGTLPMSL
jgi:hypothetical protein